jgi:hypothetical protein
MASPKSLRSMAQIGNRPVQVGPRGGRYVVGAGGEKQYVDESYGQQKEQTTAPEPPKAAEPKRAETPAAPKPAAPKPAAAAKPPEEAGPSYETIHRYKKGDSWDPKRVREVHERYTQTVMSEVPKSETPKVYMTGGGPASGKTQALLKNPEVGIPGKDKAVKADPDEAKSFIPEYTEAVARGRRKAAHEAHEESSEMAKDLIPQGLKSSRDVVYDSTGDSGIEKLEKKVKQMRADGAKEVHARYATVDVEEAIRRADARGKKTGRYVPHDYIRATHQDVAKTTLAAIERGTFDSLDLYDTGVPEGQKPKLIAKYTKSGGLEVVDNDAWEAHKARGK